jgi:hypothetical protein
LTQLLAGPIDGLPQRDAERIVGTVIGTLVGFAGTGTTPLVIYPQQAGTAALPARSAVEVQGRDVSRQVVLTFDDGDPHRPIILGCLIDDTTAQVPAAAEHIEVDADGTSLVVSAKERIVLRCGKASITLTKDGKLILQGEYVSNQSAGVLRLKGGSVHIN